MNIQVQIQVCRACLKQSESVKLVEFEAESEIIASYLDLLHSEVNCHRFHFR